jgi:hypothetical protein
MEELYAQRERDFAEAANFVKSQPGPALCESLLVCYAAGKAEEYDAYEVAELIRTGKIPEAAVARLFDERRFKVIQVDVDANQPLEASSHGRFTDGVFARLLANYRQVARTTNTIILVPRS